MLFFHLYFYINITGEKFLKKHCFNIPKNEVSTFKAGILT